MRATKIAVFDFYEVPKMLDISVNCFIELLVGQGLEFWKDYVDNEDYSNVYGYDKHGEPIRIPVLEIKGLKILAEQLGRYSN